MSGNLIAAPPPGDEVSSTEEEVAFWRTEALARLQMATWLHKGLVTKGEDDRAADLRVNTIMPTLAALDRSATGDFYEHCALCGDTIKPGDRVIQAAIGDPDDCNMVCARHGDPVHSYVHQTDSPEKIIAAARAEIEDGPDDNTQELK